MSVLLHVNNVQIHYEHQLVVNDLSFSLKKGEIGCLLGPSGCGKTTSLRAIAGFHQITAGEITLDTEVLSSPSHMLSPEKRNLGMVFQDYALFPHLTVAAILHSA